MGSTILKQLLFLIALVSLGGNIRADDLQLPVPSDQVLAAQEKRIAAMGLATQSTVGVFGTDGQGGGSGVIVSSNGYVVTNYHVSSPFGDRMRCGLANGKMYEAVIVGIDPTGDIALLKMYGRDDFPAAVIADSDTVRSGHWCFAGGNPFVLATNLQPTITYGIVSGVHRYQYPAGTILEYTDCIQTDASINPGNSGGPLFNADGHLIGINGRCSFEKRGRVNVGVGYAISINQVLKFLGQLRAGRLVDHATLGFTVATDPDGKVVVSNILETSDAFRRGLRYGDEIVSLAGREIGTVNQLKNVLGIFPSDWRIPFQFKNKEGSLETLVRLQRLHREEELWAVIDSESQMEKRKEGENPKEGEGKPIPSGTKPKVIDPLADRFEKRKGFVNYYFNRSEIKRILQTQSEMGSWKESKPVWQCSGTILGEPTNVEITIDKEQLQMRLGDREIALDGKGSWAKSIQQQESTIVLAGLALWQRWYREGPTVLGDTHYFGEAPIEGKGPLLDVVHLTFGEIETVYYSDRSSGEIKLIELYGEDGQDPAEVYFDSYDQEKGIRWPNRVRLQYGLEAKIQLELKQSRSLDSLPNRQAEPRGKP